jgi:hypothetical protein
MRPLQLALVLATTVSWLAACSRSDAPPAAPEAPAATPPVQAAPPAGPSAEAAARANAPRVASVVLGSSLDPSRRVAEAKSLFAPTDTIYASVATEGWGEPVKLTARWTYEDGQLVSESSETAEPGPAITAFHIAKPSGWPAGSYELEILADGSSVSTQRFEVR